MKTDRSKASPVSKPKGFKINKIPYLLITIALLLLIIPMVTAGTQIQSLPGIKPGQTANLIQNCANSTYSNISRIMVDADFLLNTETAMTKNGNDYNYSFSNTNKLGTYLVYGHCDENGIDTPWVYTQPVTSSNNDYFFIIVMIVIYAIAFVGFFGKNEWITIIGGLAMIGLGAYMINNGVTIYRDAITEILSWTTIGLGAFFALFTGVELINENM